MTNGMKNKDWRSLNQKYYEWLNSKFAGPDAMTKAYKRPSFYKVRDYYLYCQELDDCKLVGYPGIQCYSVAGTVRKKGKKWFRTYIGSSHAGVRMLEAPYDLLGNN